MKPAEKFDAIVIGGGHNGLVCAAYLAKAGQNVCVLERRHVLGGCATTEELWPGYKVSTAAYVISLFLPEIIRELKLREYGLKVLPRSPSSFTPLPDGRSLTMGADLALCHREIAKFSMRDAVEYPRYSAFLERVAAVLEPVLSQSAPDPLPLPEEWRRIGMSKRIRDGKKLWGLYRALGELGSDLPQAVELLTGAARPILDRWFESDVLKATLATDAIIGAFLSISSPGSAYVLLHHVMGEAGGARGVWGYVQGGMGGLAASLERACHDLGVDVRRESPVRSILTDRGRALGVRLEDGTQLDAQFVASSVDAHLTFEKFLTAEELPAYFREAVARIDYASASAKINLALTEPPRFTCLPTDGIGPHHHGPEHCGTMHIGPSLEYLERAYDDAKYGRPSERPILEMTMATSVDRTIAPPGKHLLSIFVQYAPYKLAEGNWDDLKEKFADRCIETLAEYAPNVPGAIEHRQVLSPLDLERTYGITGGNIMQGAMSAHQLFCFRPVAGWADHRTPIRGLYLCGAASHPGGGVLGACGKNAAEEMLRDL
jgi:phytoene dehydrogenase-like protein